MKPPTKIDGAEVVLWAWSEPSPFYVMPNVHGGDGMPIHGLAICRYAKGGSVYRFSCNSSWETVNDSDWGTIEAAKRGRSAQYDVDSIHWLPRDSAPQRPGEPAKPIFGDKVRVRVTEQTDIACIAGLEGQVQDEAKPSVHGLEVIGIASGDYAVYVVFEGGQDYWLAAELVEVLVQPPGPEIRLEGVDKRWRRNEKGEWQEDPLDEEKRPRWKLW